MTRCQKKNEKPLKERFNVLVAGHPQLTVVVKIPNYQSKPIH